MLCTTACSVKKKEKKKNTTGSSALQAFVRESTGHRWIPPIRGHQCGKCFHDMISSWWDDGLAAFTKDFSSALWWPQGKHCLVTGWRIGTLMIRLRSRDPANRGNSHHHSLMRFVPILHYSDVITGAMASQITSLTIVYSTVYSGADQRKHQRSASLAFVRGIHRWPVNSPAQMASNAENVSIWWRHHGEGGREWKRENECVTVTYRREYP